MTNKTPQQTMFANKVDLIKAQARIVQLEKENSMLKNKPLALAPRKPLPAPSKPQAVVPKVPLMPNGKVDSLAVTRIQMRLEQAEAKAASDAVFTKCTPKKTILNPSKYRA
jgi:hypothetical protein